MNNPGRTRYVLEKSWAVNGKIDFYVKEREGRRRKEEKMVLSRIAHKERAVDGSSAPS